MRFVTRILALAGALSLTGCVDLASLSPFVTAANGVVLPGLTGAWTDKDGDVKYVIQRAGDKYAVTSVEGARAESLEARVLRAGELNLVDLVSADDDGFSQPVHFPMRIWLEGDTLRVAFLDTAWMLDRLKGELATQVAGKRTLITNPGDAVRAALLKTCGGCPGARGSGSSDTAAVTASSKASRAPTKKWSPASTLRLVAGERD